LRSRAVLGAATLLGVHRPTITHAAQALQRAGLIECGRKRVTIRDRDGLIGASCECYLLVRARIAQHLPKAFLVQAAGARSADTSRMRQSDSEAILL